MPPMTRSFFLVPLFLASACGAGPTVLPAPPPAPATPAAAVAQDESPTDAAPALETVARLEVGPGNLTVTPDGTVFLSLHQFYSPAHRLLRIAPEGSPEPFAPPGLPALDAVLGLQFDQKGTLWLLDNGLRTAQPPKLVGWKPGTPPVTIPLAPPAGVEGSFMNDLAVDADRGFIYVADPAGGANAALVVVDIGARTARRVLEGHASVVPEDIDLVIDGTPVTLTQPDGKSIRPRIGVNPIALDASGEWLYYGAMHGTKLFRVPTEALRDSSRSAETLGGAVEEYADKPISDGISVDASGNVYLGDLANNAIGIVDAQRKYRILIEDPRLSWTDAFSYGPGGELYVVANQLHRSAPLAGGTDRSRPPYLVLKFEPVADGIVGR